MIRLSDYVRSRCIMLYWSCDNEVGTHDLVRTALRDGKKVLLPRCNTKQGEIRACEVKDLSSDLKVGAFGIWEPYEGIQELCDFSEIDFCVVPGIAFDPKGNRVGRGLGYYDRFLSNLCERTKTIGVGYAFQIVDKIYPTDGDARVDKVVTEKETLVWRRR